MQEILISIHIPKTGGTSFRQILETTYGKDNGFLLDHPWLEDVPTALKGNKLDDRKDDDIRKALKGLRCIHGHFPASKYKRLLSIDGIKPIFITWLRDPIERAVSTYYFLRAEQNGKITDNTPDWERSAKTMSLEGFLMDTPYCANRQASQLRSMPLENLSFIGCTEFYNESMDIFNRLFRPNQSTIAIPHERKNPNRTGARYELPKHVRTALINKNNHDIVLYRYAEGWVHGGHRILDLTNQTSKSPHN